MTSAPADGIALAPTRRPWPAAVAAGALLLLLGTLAAAILLSQASARSQIRSSFALRGNGSAGFVATYLSEQGARGQHVAERFLSSRRVDRRGLELITSALGSDASVLLEPDGRVLAAYPSDRSLRTTALVSAYSNLSRAKGGHVAISGVFYAPDDGAPSTAVTVPFATPTGGRLLSTDYPASNLALDALVDHTITYPQHAVYLVDSTGRLITSSPRTQAVTLARADPPLARTLSHRRRGAVDGAPAPSTFTSASVSGTPWRLLVEVPNRKLYASVAGWTQYIPWLVFALVTLIGALLVVMFLRSLADRARLTILSARMHRTAQTDSLTGLDNRRALTEQLTRASAHARRHEEPLSVMMIDLDRFKHTNDTYGHDAGDQVLCTVADCMRDVLRADDIYGRWGGDEFLVALPTTDGESARTTAERLRDTAADVPLATIGLPAGVALSVGIVTGMHETSSDLVRAADAALYRAKADGRRDGVRATR